MSTAKEAQATDVAARRKDANDFLIARSAIVVAGVRTDRARQSYNRRHITEGEGFTMDLAQAPGVKGDLSYDHGHVAFVPTIAAIHALDAATPSLTTSIEYVSSAPRS